MIQTLTDGETALLRASAKSLAFDCDRIVQVRAVPLEQQSVERLSIGIQALMLVTIEAGGDPSDNIAVAAKMAGYLIGLNACCPLHTCEALGVTARLMGQECGLTVLERDVETQPETKQ